MKIERNVTLPNREDIDVSLKLGDETLAFTIRPKSQVDQDALMELDMRMQKMEEAPKRYAQLMELISVSQSLIDSYEKKIAKLQDRKEPPEKKIEALTHKRDKELETLKPLLLERDKIGTTPYVVDPIYEERARLFCVKGFDALQQHATLLGWRETLYLIASLLEEAEEKK